MHVLVVGCGFMGFAVAAALRRAGHNVSGVIRAGNTRLKTRLEAIEIEVVEADASDVSTYKSAIEAADVVIECFPQTPNQAGRILDAVAQVAKQTKKTRRYIFTNGVLAYGDHAGRLVDESATPNPKGCLLWKAQYAEKLLSRNKAGDYLETVDMRPGWLYGEDFGRYVKWFEIGANEPIKYVGPKDKKWPWIHVNDCAAAFVAVVEAAGNVVGGQTFIVTNDTNVTNIELQKAFARAAGRNEKELELVEVKNYAPEFLAYSLLASSAKLQKATGWKPKYASLAGNEQRLYRAWKASIELSK